MKKLIKTLALAFVAIATVSVFSSCDRDDEDEFYSCNNEDYDPNNDIVCSVAVDRLSLMGDSILANVRVYYFKPGPLDYKIFELQDSLFICDSSSITKEFREPKIKSFTLRNDSILKVAETSTIYHLSTHIIYDSVHKHYNIQIHGNYLSYSLNCTDYLGHKVDVEESFVKVVENPFERLYNSYINGEEFVFVYTECFGPNNKFEVCDGWIRLKSEVGTKSNVAPLEIVNY